MIPKRINQFQKTKLDGFYSSVKADTEEHRVSALRRILGHTNKAISDLRQLEHIFIFRYLRYV